MRRLATAAFLTLTACSVEPAFVDGQLGVLRSGLALQNAGGCSTEIAAALSAQLIEVENCINPGALVSFAGEPNINYATVVNPFLEPPARAALLDAVAAVGQPITINSALRTIAQQYLLKKWEGGCGIQIAATPGSSNHETGLAIDTPNRALYQTALEARGWVWYGLDDEVHFDYAGPGAVDLRDDSVRAFQRLWNHNNPNDLLVEDGDYGLLTANRLASAPVEGFAQVPSCPALSADGGTSALDGGTSDDGAVVDADGGVVIDTDAGNAADGGDPESINGGCSVAQHASGRGSAALVLVALLLAWIRPRRAQPL